MNSKELRATFGLGAVYALRMVGVFMVLPIFELYGKNLPGHPAQVWITGAMIAASIAQALLQILLGRLSDRIGRKPLLLTSCAAFILLPYPLFSYLLADPSFGGAIAMQILFGLCIALYSGPGPAAISEIFPTRIRSTWMTTGYALSVAIFGGFAPFIATALIDATGAPIAPIFYVIAASVITTFVLLRLRETAHGELA
jgi:MFS family permease